MRHPSLARRLVTAGTVLIAVTASAVAALSYHMTRDFLQGRYRQHLQVLAQYAALQAELGLLLRDRAMLQTVAQHLLDQEDVTAVEILDQNGTPVVMVEGENRTGSGLTVETPVWTQMVDPALPGSDVNFQTRRIGSLRIQADLGGFQELVGRLILRYTGFTLALALVSVLMYGWIARSLTRPLRDLETTAVEVSRGRSDIRARGGGFRETQRVAAAFNTMLEAIQQRQKALDRLNKDMARQAVLAQLGRFSTMVAHEIKNPLTIIRGSLDALKREDPTGDTHALVVGFMEEEVRRIDRLVQDFLGFAKPLRPQTQWVAMNEWLQTVVEKYRLMAPNEQARLLVETDPGEISCRCDPQLMEQALGHLIRNALDVTPPGGTVRVRASGDGGKWFVEVTDEGPGIPAEHQAKIFEPFFTTKAKGSGLGLAMVRRIAEAHKGGIAHEGGRPDGAGGCVFRLWLPLEGEAP